MTIRSAILALGPVCYWPMDDPTGPACADATGNGNTGVFQPNTVLQVPGPEAGSFGVACPVPLGGVQLVFPNPIVLCASSSLCAAQTPVSMSMWFASAFGSSSLGRYLHIGTPASNGIGLVEAAGAWQVLYGGVALFGATVTATREVWHCCTLTYDGARYPGDPSGGVAKMYVDLAAAITVAGHIPLSTSTSDPLVASTPESGSIAHAAFWNRELTVVEHQSIYTGAVGLQSGTLTGRAATDFDTAAIISDITTLASSCSAILADLSSILASVRKTY